MKISVKTKHCNSVGELISDVPFQTGDTSRMINNGLLFANYYEVSYNPLR
jgi:hypothetical protein